MSGVKSPGRSRKRRLAWLAVVLAGGGAVFLCSPWRGRALPPPDAVVLVTIDTLRADHLGCCGYPRPTSPFIDKLAGEGVVFRRAFASSSHTTPSHASIFTSLHPVQHHALVNGRGLPPSILTMAEMFQEAGWETAGFFSVNYLGELSDGFQTFDWSTGKANYYTRAADRTVDRALAWLDELPPGARLFLWVHFFDPHEPYHPREELVERMIPGTEAERAGFLDHLTRVHGIPADFYRDEEALFRKFDGYDAEIALVDRELGRLYRAFGERDLNGNALWIITSDHGEGMGSHHYIEHSRKIYNEQLRVPLIFHHGAGGLPPGEVGELVRHVDILPTLAELIGFPLEARSPAAQGESLAGVLAGRGRPPARYAFSQRRPPAGRGRRRWQPIEMYSLQNADYKYIHHSEGEGEFYHLARDPLETRNLIGEPSPARDRMRRELEEYYGRLGSGAVSGDESEVDPKYQETLRTLGYL